MKRQTIILAGILAGAATAQDWPAFRGPTGDGVCTSETAPLTWDRKKNVKWKIELGLPANGSPIVSNGRIFLTTPEDPEGKKRSLYCYDRKDGKELWRQTIDFGRVMPTHKTNPYCGSTPAADGERVVVWHASAGLFCYDFEGKLQWKRDYGEFRHFWGYGTSPVIKNGKVILHTGPGKRSFVTALDLETGREIWKTAEPDHLTDEQREKKRLAGSWCTPLIHKAGDKLQVLCTQPTRMVAYDFESGDIVWFCKGVTAKRGDLTYSSPVLAGDICLVQGGYVGPTFGTRMDGEGDVTKTHRKWHKPEQWSNCGSGVAVDGFAYVPDMNGFVSCIDAESGKTMWKSRVGKGSSWGSIISAAGRLYIMIQRGTTVVFKPNPKKLEVLSENVLNERTNSTPAFSDGEIFLRTHKHLYCIANQT